jgi:actin-related protein
MSRIPIESKKSSLQGTRDLVSEVDLKEILVLDIGSRMLRLGLSGQNIPQLKIPNRFARLVNDPRELGSTKLPRVCGAGIFEKLKKSNESYSMEYPFIRMIEKKKNNFLKICREKQNLIQKHNNLEDLSVDVDTESLLNNSFELQESNLQEIDDDLTFLFKEIIEHDIGFETVNLETMITLNQGTFTCL